MNKKYGLLLAALLVLALALVACQPETVETVREVVVTRVVTETEVVAGETVQVTRVVPETETVRKIIDWSDLDLHHTLPSSCAVSYLRLIHALTGAASSGLGSFASAS